MKILAIDTSTKYMCLAVYDNGRLYEYNLEAYKKLSGILAVTVARIMDALGMKIKDIDYFACGLGPGSFTGLRVGLACIKGFCWVTKKPLVGISSLDILAKNALRDKNPVVPVVDAKRKLIYTCAYKNSSARLTRLKPYQLISCRELIRGSAKNSLFLGDALELYRREIISEVKGARLLDKDHWFPKGNNLIELALDKIRRKQFVNCLTLNPLYLYPKECQIK